MNFMNMRGNWADYVHSHSYARFDKMNWSMSITWKGELILLYQYVPQSVKLRAVLDFN